MRKTWADQCKCWLMASKRQWPTPDMLSAISARRMASGAAWDTVAGFVLDILFS
jgi:hypothetical protein